MRRDGATYSDTRSKSVNTNATIRRTDHLLKNLPSSPFFILPEGMSISEALNKAEKARSARNLILHSLKLHPSEIEKFDLMDFEVLGPGMNFQKTPSKWSELSKLQRSGIETLAASFSSQASYALLNTPAGRYAFNQAVDISKVYAAHKLVDRHRRLDKEMEDLEGLGFGRNRTWPTLTRAERAMLEEMAQGDWAEVKHDNLFANEGAAMRAMERLLRKMEATAKIDLRWRRKAELSHGSDRAHWRSERALII
ncbi:hypothetical protein HDU79_004632 [Rhizoclosmatium sp. JEL0117]|nr:hypothetical protein HDU79_004632 [Rhizoclosmatium sp. JEL0117]